jgi:hypothetical protein
MKATIAQNFLQFHKYYTLTKQGQGGNLHTGKQNTLFELVSLMKLLEVNAEPYCRVSSSIEQLICVLEYAEQGGRLPVDFSKELAITLGEMKREMERLELKYPLKQLQRFLDYIGESRKNGRSIDYPVIRHNLQDILGRMFDDLELRLFLAVPEDMMEFYQQKEPLFGKQVEDKFQNMSEDISEAGKCLALNRPTATVFHLMRIMEIAVQKFGDKLGVTLVQEKQWQCILDQINAAIKKMDPKKDKKAIKYAEAAAHLYNVKVSWRNEVMHPKQTYTFDEAKTIFINVKTFIFDLTGIL